MTEAPSDWLLAGLDQALQSLFSVATRSRGALTVELDSMRQSKGVLEVRIWLASASLPSSDQGIPLAEWEPIDLQIAADFPLQAPVASSGRDDFPELPHQPQGSRFCVRVPSSDWNPSAGMSGFLRAVISTYGHIALGTLEGKLQPWHPMDHYLGAGCVVVRMDLPRPDPPGRLSLLGHRH